jgi:hypothetical protein
LFYIFNGVEEMETKTLQVTQYPDGRMDAKNASFYLGYSEKTLAMMRCDGTGPQYIKRGRIFYFKDDLDAWLNQSGKVKSTAQARFSKAD